MAFRAQEKFCIKGISSESFGQILQYMYTGAITIRKDNIFDLFESLHFLQMQEAGDPLMQSCISYMTNLLQSSVNLPSSLVVKVS